MEEQINKDFLNYHEQLFLGLTLRQTVCSVIALAIGAIIFLSQSTLGADLASWLCILAALPFILIGFVSWHGMPAEKVFVIWLRDLLLPQKLRWRSVNLCHSAYAAEQTQTTKKEQDK